MKPIPAIVEHDQSVDRLVAAVRAAASDLREAEVQEQKSEVRAARAREVTAARRLELGRALVQLRKAFPRSGPKAKGWGELLEREGIAQQTAWNLMQLAGYVEEVSPDHGETPTVAAALRARARDVDERPDPPDPPELPAGFKLDLRVGRWQDVLADVGTVDALITDPPYSKRTHDSRAERTDGYDKAGLAPSYEFWTREDVDAFVDAWSPRVRGWMVALTDHNLLDAWERAFARNGRYSFAPVACVIQGMTVRLGGDGPSSWAVYAMVARPTSLAKWGTLPGAYVGNRDPGSTQGRGKPAWLMDAIVGDYTREGDLVCDPLAGYGTTLTSAIALRRRAVGAELEFEAAQEAQERFRSRARTFTAA